MNDDFFIYPDSTILYPFFPCCIVLRSFLLPHPERCVCTKSLPPLGSFTNLRPSGSTRIRVSQQVFLPLRNQWYVFPLGFVCDPINPNSFPSSRLIFLFGYSHFFCPFVRDACFWSCAFLAAIPCLFVLLAIITLCIHINIAYIYSFMSQ